jgi:hypothetical protein
MTHDTQCVVVGAGGASRDRTGDLLVANQTLSQLSYGPLGLICRTLGQWKPPDSTLSTLMLIWWVWEELNLRPHPYQGCALTN